MVKESKMNYILDNSRKRITANRIGEIIPFSIVEHSPGEKALIIERKGAFFMSIKRGQKIVLYPMTKVEKI